MKSLIALSAVSLFSLAFHAVADEVDLPLPAGDSVRISVEGCKPSEYGALVSDSDSESEGTSRLSAVCRPKVCFYTTPTLFGTVIELRPGGAPLATTHSPKETKERLAEFLRDGVCEKTESALRTNL